MKYAAYRYDSGNLKRCFSKNKFFNSIQEAEDALGFRVDQFRKINKEQIDFQYVICDFTEIYKSKIVKIINL